MFGGYYKKLYLCIRFPKGTAFKEEFFERFRYKQASSTRLLIIIGNNRNRQ